MCVQRSDALQLGPFGAVDELPGSIDSCTRTTVTGNRRLEDRKEFLGAFDHEARYRSQLVHGELEVAGLGRHET